MTGSTCWLLTAINMYICTSVWMLLAPLLVASTPSRPFLRQVLQSLCLSAPHHRRLKDNFFPQSWFLPRTWVSKQGSWRHCRDGPHRDVPLQWHSFCSCKNQQGFLHHLYTRWQHIMLLCSWAGFKEANTCNVQQSRIQSVEKRKNRFRSWILICSYYVHCLSPWPPVSLIQLLKEICYFKDLWKLSHQLEMFRERCCDIQL